MKRTTMKSRGPRTKKSGGALFPKGVDEGLREYVRGLPCILLGRSHVAARDATGTLFHYHYCALPVQVCHVKTRGSGGADRNNVYPGCRAAHDSQHLVGIATFQKTWGVNLKNIAHTVTAKYEAERFPCP